MKVYVVQDDCYTRKLRVFNNYKKAYKFAKRKVIKFCKANIIDADEPLKSLKKK